MRLTLNAALIMTLLAGSAAASQGLRQEQKVENGLFAIAVADKIRSECATISGRVLKALSQMQELADYAQSIGYSRAEIKAYTQSDIEKQRMEAKRDAYLRTQGVVQSDPETYCAAGHAEIQRSSRIGGLLRAR